MQLANLLYEKSGIHLAAGKKSLLEGRIRKRMHALGYDNLHQYSAYIQTKDGLRQELEMFINVLTTNKTEFMREFGHFEFLLNTGLDFLYSQKKHLRFWSSACSLGAEPYTLAMVLEEYLRKNSNRGLSYSIDATDISTKVLQHAHTAVYSEDDIKPVPQEWRKRYLLRGMANREGEVRIIPQIRANVQFVHLNLMDAFPWNYLHDVIFCRNVIIYFNRETQLALTSRLLDSLSPDGYLLMGHSESLDFPRTLVRLCAPSVYQKV